VSSRIGIGIGYWHWDRPILLGIGCLVWYRSNPAHAITGLKGGFAAGGNGGGLWEKVAKEEGKGETERGREGGRNGERQ